MQNNLKNEDHSALILRHGSRKSTLKPLETRQITLDSPCAKCGSFVRWVSASEVNHLHKCTTASDSEQLGYLVSSEQLGYLVSSEQLGYLVSSEQLGLRLTNEGGAS